MGWDGDYLGRAAFARHLAELMLARYKARKSFIANLDAPWGQGKTFFLERLKVDLEGRGFAVAYVNAWRDDRTDDPLITVLEAIDEAVGARAAPGSIASSTLKSAKRKLTPVVAEVGKQIGLHALKLTLGFSLDKALEAYGAQETLQADEDAIGSGLEAAVAKLATDYVDDRLQAQRAARLAIEQFRNQIQKALHESGMELPLFVIVDELDRCRPPYAVKMLEDLKHIFAIDGVVFLIGTDSVQLSHSIKALYGDQFDSAKYLRRFFDRVIAFPPSARDELVDAHLATLGVESVTFSPTQALQPTELLSSLFDSQNYSNRDILQFFEILDTFIASWSEPFAIEPILLFALIDDYLQAPNEFAQISHPINHDRRGNWFVERAGDQIYIERTVKKILEFSREDLRRYDPTWPANVYFADEYNATVANRMTTGHPVPSVLSTFKDRILLSARLTDKS